MKELVQLCVSNGIRATSLIYETF